MKTSEIIIFTLSPIILGLGMLHSYTIISRDMPHLMPDGPYPGDNVIPDAVMVYDQTELILAPPEAVWPWVLQVGKGRGGWYAPTWFEKILPKSAHASRIVHSEYQTLQPGDRVPDYGFSADDYFIVEEIQPNHALVYKSDRYGATFSWSLILHELKDRGDGRGLETLLHLRFRGKIAATGLKRKAIVRSGGILDHWTTLPMMSGMKERAEKGWEEIQAKKG